MLRIVLAVTSWEEALKRFIVVLAAVATAAVGTLLPFSASYADTVGLDPTFGDNGFKTVALLGGDDQAMVALPDPDGKILVAGPTSYPDQNGKWFMIRTDPNGKDLDGSFGNKNLGFYTYFEGDVGKISDATIGSDRSIYAVGTTTSSAQLIKLDKNAKATTWKVSIPAPGGGKFVPQKVVVDNDSVTVAGTNDAATTLRVARYNLAGQPLASFDGDGIADFNLTMLTEQRAQSNVSMAVDSTKRVYVLVGNETLNDGVATQLLRINVNGTKDGAYGGVVGNKAQHGRGLVLMPGGGAAAAIADMNTGKAALQMFDVSGHPTVRTPVPGNEYDSPRGLTQTREGRLVMVARGTVGAAAVKLFGFTNSGALDPNFATGGTFVYTNANTTSLIPNNIGVDSSGRLLVPGGLTPKTGGVDSHPDVAVFRFKVTPTATPSPTVSPSSPVAPPIVRPTFSRVDTPSVSKSKLLSAITGRAGGTGVTKVQVVVRRVDAKAQRKKTCFFLNAAGSLKKVSVPVKSCGQPSIIITATGTNAWSVHLAKPLKPGTYYVNSRAFGKGGVSPWASKVIRITKK